MAELLLEILSEEIPARMQARAADDLKRLICDGLKAAGIGFEAARAYVTPRRLALVVEGIPAVRDDVSEEKRGPRVGAPDQAVQGFLKGAGLASLDQAEKRDTGKGEFWFAVITKKGGPTAEALPQVIDAAMKALPWPKSMKWGSGTMQWVRPLQGIVALFDGKVLKGEVSPGGAMAPVVFGDTTRGHRFLSKGQFTVTNFADYEAKLRAAHVILDPAERKKIILEGARKLCGDAQVTLRDDDGLVDEVTGLVEWPVPLIGTIDAQFMDVPAEVLIVSMKVHLRHFTTTKADGTLANRFIVVANNVARDGGKVIVEGNERVLRARLSDAKFFWDQDRKTTLESRLPRLEQVVFHEELGTQAERVRRIVELAGIVAKDVPGADPHQVEQAARLCKADLLSGMVGEFPELQGVMGRYYALGEKLPAAVADAIGDHYAPAGPSDRCPSAPVSVAVALADKLHTLISFWSIGVKPTGSRDPYGLRRAALGAIRLVVDNNLRIRLRPIFARYVPREGDNSRGAFFVDLRLFFIERLKVQMREKGVRHDVIDAVFAVREDAAAVGQEDDLVKVLKRVAAIQTFLATEEGKNLLMGYGRAANIVRAEEKKDKALTAKIADAPDAALLEQAEEKAVASALEEVAHTVRPALAAEDFAGAMAAFAGLRGPIDAFFDKVTVNVADRPEIRLNRLKLLNQIRATMDTVADFSKIEG